jgi:hypothetical protein
LTGGAEGVRLKGSLERRARHGGPGETGMLS